MSGNQRGAEGREKERENEERGSGGIRGRSRLSRSETIKREDVVVVVEEEEEEEEEQRGEDDTIIQSVPGRLSAIQAQQVEHI